MQAIEFGDFQTPEPLAAQVVELVRSSGMSPRSVLEPTVGTGALLAAALHAFPSCERVAGLDINAAHLREARARTRFARARVTLTEANVFSVDLAELVSSLPRPVLILGNPPWVTNARQGSLRSSNLPAKTNDERRRGIDAITGQANFDVSEWIIVRLLEALAQSEGMLAMLCKTRVARRVLAQSARRSLAIQAASIHAIDAAASFGAAVDACVFVCRSGAAHSELSCDWYPGIDAPASSRTLLFTRGIEVADARGFRREQGLYRPSSTRWRSGIKHDCARVMELEGRADGLYNGLGERVELEPEHVFPLLKGSDLIAGRLSANRFVLVPQRAPGEDPGRLQHLAPRTWQVLQAHADALSARASSIFRKRPPFSIFGVGPYTFSPWKLAVPALHKTLVVHVVGPRDGRPVVFDDTCYLLACNDEAHARVLHALLGLPPARRLLESLIFWGDKRPIRADALGSVDVARLAGSCRAQVHARLGDSGLSGASIERALDAIAHPKVASARPPPRGRLPGRSRAPRSG